jgi:hypothetical protein
MSISKNRNITREPIVKVSKNKTLQFSTKNCVKALIANIHPNLEAWKISRPTSAEKTEEI